MTAYLIKVVFAIHLQNSKSYYDSQSWVKMRVYWTERLQLWELTQIPQQAPAFNNPQRNIFLPPFGRNYM